MGIYMAAIAAITIVIWGISVFCFRKITVDYIETKMAEEGGGLQSGIKVLEPGCQCMLR
jgi:hypothetical protein